MLKKILIASAAALPLLAVVTILVIAANKPDTFHVERHTLIAAPPEAIFSNIDDLHRWPAWSPWEKLDPNMHKTYDGPAHGKGASYTWTGNGKVGEGSATIVETSPNQRVVVRLQFVKPFKATDTAEYALRPEHGGTQVSWTMEGPNTFIGKIFSVFADMDHMIGKDFETGLANLKRVSEAGGATAAD